MARCHPPLISAPLSAHTGTIKRLSEVRRERARRGERVSGCFTGNAIKQSVSHIGAAHFKVRIALVLSTFGRGFERRRVSHPSSPFVNVPFKLLARSTKLLVCSPRLHTFYFNFIVPLSPRLDCLFPPVFPLQFALFFFWWLCVPLCLAFR